MAKILIAEDQYIISSLLAKGLQRKGFDTHIAEDGEQALCLALSGNFDIVLLDLSLPIRDGWSVLREIRRQSCPMPVIVISAPRGYQKQQLLKQQGANGVMIKPFHFEDLLVNISHHL